MVRHWGCRFRCVWFWGCFQTFWADFAFKLLDVRLRNCRNCLQLVPLCKFMLSKHSWSFVPIRRWGCFAGSSQCFLVRYHSAVITSNGDVATFGSKITKCWKLSSLLLWRWSTPSWKNMSRARKHYKRSEECLDSFSLPWNWSSQTFPCRRVCSLGQPRFYGFLHRISIFWWPLNDSF